NHAQQWGKCHPYKLQLAGYYLWEARQQGKAIKWAKQQFDQQLANPKSKAKGQQWQLWLRLLWDIPLHLGRLATFIGASWDDVKSRITGMVVLIVIVLGLVGVLTLPQVKEWLGKMFNGK
ncbi:MAG: ATP-binding protein, partial [Nostoc sp.]